MHLITYLKAHFIKLSFKYSPKAYLQIHTVKLKSQTTHGPKKTNKREEGREGERKQLTTNTPKEAYDKKYLREDGIVNIKYPSRKISTGEVN